MTRERPLLSPWLDPATRAKLIGRLTGVVGGHDDVPGDLRYEPSGHLGTMLTVAEGLAALELHPVIVGDPDDRRHWWFRPSNGCLVLGGSRFPSIARAEADRHGWSTEQDLPAVLAHDRGAVPVLEAWYHWAPKRAPTWTQSWKGALAALVSPGRTAVVFATDAGGAGTRRTAMLLVVTDAAPLVLGAWDGPGTGRASFRVEMNDRDLRPLTPLLGDPLDA